MTDTQANKAVVRGFYDALAAAGSGQFGSIIAEHTSSDYRWRGMHPFDGQRSAMDSARVFWEPLSAAFSSMQRREDVFMAGTNTVDPEGANWVISMGKLLGLFDRDWLGIPANGRMIFLPYADFHRIADGKIVETVGFCDVLNVMQQAGQCPLPSQTGATVVFPGPRTHDGLIHTPQDEVASQNTLKLINKMIRDLLGADMSSPKSELESVWLEDMCWYGPAGIGATFTIDRYLQQHQGPFTSGLSEIQYDGHECLVAEGNYGGLFSWSGFTMKPTGGFMGLPASESSSTMRVADIYRREGDKLAENWVFIDMLHFLNQQGLDVLGRIKELNGRQRDEQQ